MRTVARTDDNATATDLYATDQRERASLVASALRNVTGERWTVEDWAGGFYNATLERVDGTCLVVGITDADERGYAPEFVAFVVTEGGNMAGPCGWDESEIIRPGDPILTALDALRDTLAWLDTNA